MDDETFLKQQWQRILGEMRYPTTRSCLPSTILMPERAFKATHLMLPCHNGRA